MFIFMLLSMFSVSILATTFASRQQSKLKDIRRASSSYEVMLRQEDLGFRSYATELTPRKVTKKKRK